MKLTPCTSCARLVRIADAACPFCGALVSAADTGTPVARHLSRAAMLVGAAAPDAGLDGSDDAKSDGPIAMYGGPPVDSGLDAAPDSPVAAYGGPPFDASKQD